MFCVAAALPVSLVVAAFPPASAEVPSGARLLSEDSEVSFCFISGISSGKTLSRLKVTVLERKP
jgi:hypothetical protein